MKEVNGTGVEIVVELHFFTICQWYVEHDELTQISLKNYIDSF